jgi:hypothetical protein
MNGAITWGQVAYSVGMLTAVGGLWWRFVDPLRKRLDGLDKRIDGLEKSLADFKLEVAKEYATTSAIEQVEERVVAAINRLGDRLDKLFVTRNPA